jgi:hypothetical protein
MILGKAMVKVSSSKQWKKYQFLTVFISKNNQNHNDDHLLIELNKKFCN